jgi:hypothetical protein
MHIEENCGLLGCDNRIYWEQAVVWRITDERREVGHVDITEEPFGDHVGITPFADGSLWIETVVGDIYHVTP